MSAVEQTSTSEVTSPAHRRRFKTLHLFSRSGALAGTMLCGAVPSEGVQFNGEIQWEYVNKRCRGCEVEYLERLFAGKPGNLPPAWLEADR